MDVVVKPSSGRKGLWELNDRLGRKLGEIAQVRPDHFVIHSLVESEPGSLRRAP